MEEIAFIIFLIYILFTLILNPMLFYILNKIYLKVNNKRLYQDEYGAIFSVLSFIGFILLIYYIIEILLIKKYRNRRIDKIDFKMEIDTRPGTNVFFFNHQYILKIKCKYYNCKVGSKECTKCKYYIKTNDIPSHFHNGNCIKEVLNVECCIEGKNKTKI